MGGGKVMEALAAESPAREVKLAQRFHHPDIHRECGLEAIAEQEDTVSNLPADTWQLHQLGAGGLDRQRVQAGQVALAAGNQARGRQQVRGSAPSLA